MLFTVLCILQNFRQYKQTHSMQFSIKWLQLNNSYSSFIFIIDSAKCLHTLNNLIANYTINIYVATFFFKFKLMKRHFSALLRIRQWKKLFLGVTHTIQKNIKLTTFILVRTLSMLFECINKILIKIYCAWFQRWVLLRYLLFIVLDYKSTPQKPYQIV